jgi:medium-chain acyl-[acyl-carrier-protein] hydrolase
MSYQPHIFLSQAKRAQVRIRLFCFPYAGGGASMYNAWSEEMPPEIEVCAVQLPGRENRFAERPFSNLPALTNVLLSEIKPYLDMPFAFFGHSMGALISFELAHALQKEFNCHPQYLFVSGHRAPHLPGSRQQKIYNLPTAEFMQELRLLNGTPAEVLQSEELFELLLPALRADFELCETYSYQHQEQLSCPIFALNGLQDDDVSREMVEGWREHTTGAFSRRFFAGDHFFVRQYRSLITRLIAQHLSGNDTVCEHRQKCVCSQRFAS